MLPNFSRVTDDGSSYVKNMTHHAHIDINNETTVSFEDTVADGTELHAAKTFVAAETVKYTEPVDVAEAFGRSLLLTATAAGDVTVHGFDYLGQVMTETVSCIDGDIGTTKAFRQVTSIESVDFAGDITIKMGSEYGLPFCVVKMVREIVNGVAAADGVISAPDSATPTAETGDTRGTYNPNTDGTGGQSISVTYVTTSQLSGGLYGQPQA